MKVLKKLGIIGLFLSLAIGVVGCSSSEDKSKKDDTASEETVTLNISAAASLQEAMAELETKFKEIEPNVKLEVNRQVSTGDPVYKLITDESWSLVIPLDQRLAAELAEKSTVRFRFLKDGTTFNAGFSIVQNNGTDRKSVV